MNGIANALGSHQIIGGLITVLACITFLSLEYIRLKQSARLLAYALTVRRIAITLTVISVILMGSRFVAVVSKYGGV